MKLITYLTFDGNCKSAFEFYQRVLGGELFLMPFAGSPMAEQVPADHQHRIMHACLQIGDQMLMASDTMPGTDYDGINGSQVSLHVESPDEADLLYRKLSDNGKVEMELQETFWAQKFGSFVDQFGVPWMVNCSKPQ